MRIKYSHKRASLHNICTHFACHYLNRFQRRKWPTHDTGWCETAMRISWMKENGWMCELNPCLKSVQCAHCFWSAVSIQPNNLIAYTVYGTAHLLCSLSYTLSSLNGSLVFILSHLRLLVWTLFHRRLNHFFYGNQHLFTVLDETLFVYTCLL